MRHGQCPPAGRAGPDRMRSIQSRSGWETRVPGHPSIPHDLRHQRRSSVETPVQTVIQIVEHRLMPFQSRPHARALLVAGARRRRRDSRALPSRHQPLRPRRFRRRPRRRRHRAPTQNPPATGPTRSLSIDEAVQLALQQNLGIQIERLNPQLQDYTIAQALANYTPIAGVGAQLAESGFSRPAASCRAARRRSPTRTTASRRSTRSSSPGARTPRCRSTARGRRRTTSSIRSIPTLTGNLDLTITQPLLRNFKLRHGQAADRHRPQEP